MFRPDFSIMIFVSAFVGIKCDFIIMDILIGKASRLNIDQ